MVSRIKQIKCLELKSYLLILIFAFCFYPGIADAIGINSFRPLSGYLVSRSDIGAGAVSFMTDNGMTALDGRYGFFSYRTNQRRPHSTQRILDHYMSLVKRAGGEIVWAANVSLGGRNFVGKVNTGGQETWISVQIRDLRNYDVSLLQRSVTAVPRRYSAQNTQAMKDSAEALILLETVDRTGQLQLDVSFKPGSAILRSSPSQLRRIAAMMRMDPSYNFRVEAPVDFPSTGTSEERRILARNRQRAIYDALVASGVPPSRLAVEYPLGQAPEEISRARIVLI